MAIVERVKRAFSQAVRARAMGYLDEIIFLDTGAHHVAAHVHGQSRDHYRVTVIENRGQLRVHCDCPFFESAEPCKHLWAVLVKAEQQGLIPALANDANLTVEIGSAAIMSASLRAPILARPTARHLRVVDKPDVPDAASELDDPDDVDDFNDEEWDDDDGKAKPAHRDHHFRAVQFQPRAHTVARRTAWQQTLAAIVESHADAGGPVSSFFADADVQLVYVLDIGRTRETGKIAVEINIRKKKLDGRWGGRQARSVGSSDIPYLREAVDRQIVSLLVDPRSDTFYGYQLSSARYALGPQLAEHLLPMICNTGRCVLKTETRSEERAAEPVPLTWDSGPAWQTQIKVDHRDDEYLVTGELVRADERQSLTEPILLTASGLVIGRETVARFDSAGFPWVAMLRQTPELPIPVSGRADLMRALYSGDRRPLLQIPDELRLEEVRSVPTPFFKMQRSRSTWSQGEMTGHLSFDYGGTLRNAFQADDGLLDLEGRRLLTRDHATERDAISLLRTLGFNLARYYESPTPPFVLQAEKCLPIALRKLIAAGWRVEAEGKAVRRPGKINLSVESGIDWFELNGGADFDGVQVELPRLLAALKRGDATIVLGDGTTGILPEEWLEKYARLGDLGATEDGHLRFGRNQAGVLDALLATMPEVSVDEVFSQARAKLSAFAGVAAQNPTKGFCGTLRGYQREGLGWLSFLRDMGFGGCLADDMGLGKTVQVLAMLESRREQTKQKIQPSIVVVPRSLMFNWRAEAGHFTPKLRILDHVGPERPKEPRAFDDYDLILTTYGTLRRDAQLLCRVDFDYVILDEAQAIKNAGTNSSKAARLLQGQHRLALSGTPIENHLGELWSLFEFLNPGMLGSSAFAKWLDADARDPSHETRTFLARALRPFILRRTKEQVAKDLPARTEQTLYCDVDGSQRKLYDELRDHYRASLLGRVDEVGLNKSKMHVLEALLRLRQAACHPGLLDTKLSDETSAKLDTLLPMLDEVTDGDHKALVFSQFTSFLGLVRKRLDDQGLVYEYLDGRTRDRAAKVERFQTDPKCKLFLISLKAGGLGLNLTAADYVFLLDPWWNPAVEAQAVDRTHRIGQTRQVFAYRLVARNTIEEKVLALQERKRGLADDIINADNALLRKLKREDLEMLLE